MDSNKAMTAESVGEIVKATGAEVMVRSGRSDNYSAPRDFSFEVKALLPNGMGMHIVARQFNYRDPWEAKGRVNDMVDVMLLRDGNPTQLPKGFQWFQGVDEECGVDEERLKEIVECVSKVNVKLYLLQEMSGDL